ncbi:uridine diphosphate glucose pyrophosphatase NUDT14-like [Cydia splendana]|uniref:uridine diphosphate glucose pyrophosphatase NUDT14-like n=1 Tax=Cydia splendana TaxID=1100963 RepID=UPI00214610CE
MEDVKNIRVTPMPESKYVKPLRFHYTQNGKEKNWDLLAVHDSVAIVIYNVTRKVLVLVKQFRPAMHFNSILPEDREKETIDIEKYPPSLGLALEICAGIVDKEKSVVDIAIEEVLEECGYNVPAEKMERIISYRSGVGVQAALQTLFFCEVSDDMKTERGGGVDDELIDIVEMTIPEMEKLLSSPGPVQSPPSFLFAMMWFLHNKASKYIRSFAYTCSECKKHKPTVWDWLIQ